MPGAMPIYETHETVVDGKLDGKALFQVPVHMELIKKVGTGAYGCVAAFRDTRNNEQVAVKKITNAFDDLVDGKRILREVKILMQLDHDNIIRVFDMFPPPSPDFEDIYIVTDLMETDLHRVIYSQQPLTEEHHVYFVHQMLRALVYLHAAQIVHRDLKPPNLLVNKDCSLKICDFGLARVLAQDDGEDLGRTDYVVTRWYRAPEVVLLASEYTIAIDVWAVGCILAELITRKPVFNGKDHLDQIRKIIDVLGAPTEEEMKWLPENGSARTFLMKCSATPKADWETILPEASPAAIEVIQAMLRFNPAVRIDAQNALRMRYFETLFEEEDMEQDTDVRPLDWSFDNFKPAKLALQNYIYCECASFHPEIVERDRAAISQRDGLGQLLVSRSISANGVPTSGTDPPASPLSMAAPSAVGASAADVSADAETVGAAGVIGTARMTPGV